MEFPIAFLSHTFSRNAKIDGAPQTRKLTEFTIQLPNGTIISQGGDIIVCRMTTNHYTNSLMAKIANNKFNRWGWELAIYNFTFEWISGACNKAADCPSCLVKLPQEKPVLVNMLSATNT